MQQGPQLLVLPLQALCFTEELTDVCQCHTGNTGNRRSTEGAVQHLVVDLDRVCMYSLILC